MQRWLTWRNVVLALSGLYALIFALMLLIHPGSDRFYTDFNNTYQILAPLFAAVCGITYSCKGSHASRSSRIRVRGSSSNFRWMFETFGAGHLPFRIQRRWCELS